MCFLINTHIRSSIVAFLRNTGAVRICLDPFLLFAQRGLGTTLVGNVNQFTVHITANLTDEYERLACSAEYIRESIARTLKRHEGAHECEHSRAYAYMYCACARPGRPASSAHYGVVLKLGTGK